MKKGENWLIPHKQKKLFNLQYPILTNPHFLDFASEMRSLFDRVQRGDLNSHYCFPENRLTSSRTIMLNQIFFSFQKLIIFRDSKTPRGKIPINCFKIFKYRFSTKSLRISELQSIY